MYIRYEPTDLEVVKASGIEISYDVPQKDCGIPVVDYHYSFQEKIDIPFIRFVKPTQRIEDALFLAEIVSGGWGGIKIEAAFECYYWISDQKWIVRLGGFSCSTSGIGRTCCEAICRAIVISHKKSKYITEALLQNTLSMNELLEEMDLEDNNDL